MHCYYVAASARQLSSVIEIYEKMKLVLELFLFQGFLFQTSFYFQLHFTFFPNQTGSCFSAQSILIKRSCQAQVFMQELSLF